MEVQGRVGRGWWKTNGEGGGQRGKCRFLVAGRRRDRRRTRKRGSRSRVKESE